VSLIVWNYYIYLHLDNFAKQWAASKVTVNLQDTDSVTTASRVADEFATEGEAIQKQFESLSKECSLAKLKQPEGKEGLEGVIFIVNVVCLFVYLFIFIYFYFF
jgi:type VI protein secretion system component VasK